VFLALFEGRVKSPKKGLFRAYGGIPRMSWRVDRACKGQA